MRAQFPAEPPAGPAAAFSTSWLQHLRDQESSDSDCETGASSSEEEEEPGVPNTGGDASACGVSVGWAGGNAGATGVLGGAEPSKGNLDESFGTALKRLKNDGTIRDASPNTKGKADVEFRRLAKSNSKAGKFIKRRAAPSKEGQQREKEEGEERRRQRRYITAAPHGDVMRRLEQGGQMFPLISARGELKAPGVAEAVAAQPAKPPQPPLTAKPPDDHRRNVKKPKTPRARSASVPNGADKPSPRNPALSSLPVPHLNTPRQGRGHSARVKQAAMRARSAHILRCPARSTHIAALSLKEYQPPVQQPRTTSDLEQQVALAATSRRVPEELLSRMAQRRPHMEGLPLVIIAVEGTVLDVCCSRSGYFADGGELLKPALHVRPGLAVGLRCLSSSFQLVLATQLGRKPLLQLLKHLGANDVAVDAIYMLSGASGAGGGNEEAGGSAGGASTSGWGHRAAAAATSTTQDYSCVYSDFGIAAQDVGQRVLVVSTLNLDLDEVSAREGSRLLYTPSVSAPNFAARLPTPLDLSTRFDDACSVEPSEAPATSPVQIAGHDGFSGVAGGALSAASTASSGFAVPVVLLVPNPMSHSEFRALPMMAVASAVQALCSSAPPPAAEKYVTGNSSMNSSSSSRVPRSNWVRGFDQIDVRRLVGRAAALDCPLKKITAIRSHRAPPLAAEEW